MEVNFGKEQTPVIDVVGTVASPVEGVTVETRSGAGPSLPVATIPNVGVPATASAADGFITGDYLPGFKDIILPPINIVQGTGDLKDSFAQGSIVFGQNLEVFKMPVIDKATGNPKVAGTAPLNITIIGFKPIRFVEKLSQAGRSAGLRGALVNTEAEVRAAGGTLDYNEWKLKESSGMKRFEILATAFILVKRPECVADDNTVFTFEVGADKYALALWNMKGTSYTHAAKRVFFTARKMGCLKVGGYPSWNYSISTRTETFAGNTFYVPVALPCAPTTPEVLAFIADLLNPAAE